MRESNPASVVNARFIMLAHPRRVLAAAAVLFVIAVVLGTPVAKMLQSELVSNAG